MQNQLLKKLKLKKKSSRWPAFGWLGIALVAVFWPLNWFLPGLRTHWGFFPLWLGYILLVEAVTFYRQGHSLLTGNGKAFAGLFLLSAPAWWIFEALNSAARYWVYIPIESFSELEYYLYCTINFSVVLPAVFSTTELFASFRWLRELKSGWKIGRSPLTMLIFFILGWLMLAVVLIWPKYGFAFLWTSLFFILDPLNYRLGIPSLLGRTARGDWRLVLALWLGCLLCGFFWEFWNYYSSPRWIYQIPFVDFWHVFEMPLPGYLGYLPFALELYALYQLMVGWDGEGRFAVSLFDRA